ncbi:MAG: hypothetical protein JW818_18555 [Pirellulales bacterium]|nr:hypothetical protein [Pirellulales bacterium]
MKHLTLDPQVPLALWVPLALAAAGLLAWYATSSRGRLPGWRRPVVLGLMALAVAIPLVILLNPTWLERLPPPPGQPKLAVLVDRSDSMATRDMDSGKSRYEVALALAERMQEELKNRYEVDVRYFAADSTPLAAAPADKSAPDSSRTDLATAIDDILAADRPQGQAVVLLSDGVNNSSAGVDRLRQSVARAKSMAAPVYARTVGGQTTVKDLAVRLNMPQELAFVSQKVPVAVTLRQRGAAVGKTTVSLTCDGKQLDQREVDLSGDSDAEALFEVAQSKPGLYRYEIRAGKLPGEITDANNRATLLLRVVDQPVRVLLLEGKPYWDTKFLVRTLALDASVELVSVVQLREGRFLKRTIARSGSDAKGDQPKFVQSNDWTIDDKAARILADSKALEKYQVVVLGRNADVFLDETALTNLKKWLAEDSGSLVCFRGPPAAQISQRLGNLMPVSWAPQGESRFRVHFTEAGRSLRWLASSEGDELGNLPSLATAARVDKPKPLAVILAEAGSSRGDQVQPAVIYQPVGSGRVVVVEGAGMWRWAFLPPEHQQHDDVYATLWRNLIRWLVANVGLMPSQQYALQVDKVTFSTSETPTASLLVAKDRVGSPPPVVELRGDGLKEPQRIVPLPSGADPGQFRVVLDRPLPAGAYELRVAGADPKETTTAVFDVCGDLSEQLEVRARPDVMRMIARRSGGAVLDQVEPEAVAEQFETHLTRSRPERTIQALAWDRWWVLTAALALWATAWGLRRRSGLI